MLIIEFYLNIHHREGEGKFAGDGATEDSEDDKLEDAAGNNKVP